MFFEATLWFVLWASLRSAILSENKTTKKLGTRSAVVKLSKIKKIKNPEVSIQKIILIFSYFPPSQSLKNKCNFFLYFCCLPFTVSNLFKAIFLGPGYAPKEWKPKHQEDEQFLQFCKVCEGFKPPRAHHCRKCKRCCLKMDHHCIWLSQCVG